MSLTFPPLPPSSPTRRERRGEIVSLTFPFPFLFHAAGEGLGVRAAPHLPPSAPTRRERRGDARSRGDPAAVQITPLPQRGRGAGGEGYPQRGRGARGEGYPQRGRGAGGEGSPSPSPSSSTRRERRGEERSRGDPAAVQITPLPQRGSGAGGEEHPSPAARERGWG